MQHRTTVVYAKVWLFTRTVALCLEILAVREIFVHWTVHHPGIGRFGTALMWSLIVISTAVALVVIPINATRSGWPIAFQLCAILNRSTQAGLVAFLGFVLLFFALWGSPAISPNLRRHSWAMTAFASANVAGYFTMAAHAWQITGLLLEAVAIAAQGFWIVGLTAAGERVPDLSPVDPVELRRADEFSRGLFRIEREVRRSL